MAGTQAQASTVDPATAVGASPSTVPSCRSLVKRYSISSGLLMGALAGFNDGVATGSV